MTCRVAAQKTYQFAISHLIYIISPPLIRPSTGNGKTGPFSKGVCQAGSIGDRYVQSQSIILLQPLAKVLIKSPLQMASLSNRHVGFLICNTYIYIYVLRYVLQEPSRLDLLFKLDPMS